MPPSSPKAGLISEDAKLAFLASGAAFGGAPVTVEETHMAWVFLAGDLAFKLKKPATYSFLDFSTIEARQSACREELRLNRRLAKKVYLAVLPLTRAADGAFAVDGEGEIVDWLVKMRRLPADRMLDALIERSAVGPREIAAIGARLARFFRTAVHALISPEEYLRLFAEEHEKNREMLFQVDRDLPRREIDAALGAIERMLSRRRSALDERALGDHIVDGHGDLKPEHICLIDPLAIIDCLEFNARLRMVDPFDEICYLGIECERLGAAWIGRQLIDDLAHRLGERPPLEVLAFYRIYRSTLRARLSVAHLLEPNARTPEKWIPRARQYLAIAGASAKDIA